MSCLHTLAATGGGSEDDDYEDDCKSAERFGDKLYDLININKLELKNN